LFGFGDDTMKAPLDQGLKRHAFSCRYFFASRKSASEMSMVVFI
jgi:hypothetical protein